MIQPIETTEAKPKGLKIGNIQLDVPFIQAALSGYSDRAMRQLAREFGCPLTLPGVMLDTTTVNPTVIRKGINAIGDDEHPIGGQIMGSTADVMAEAAKVIESLGYDFVDLNFACPVPKVLRRCRGGHLMSHPDELIEIFQRVRDAVKCPVAMKLRAGFDRNDEDMEHFWKICEMAADRGVDMLAVHGRTVIQRYKSFPDWSILAELKQRLPNTTIIGSGNLFSSKVIAQKLKQTGVDGALIARGAIGNPWIFPETKALMNDEPAPTPPTVEEQGDVILRHFNMMAEDYYGGKAIGMFRKFSVRYCRRHPEKNKVQVDLMAAESADELRAAIKKWYGVG